MVNTKAIKDQIKLRNTTMEAVAKEVGIHSRTFSNKVNNLTPFTVTEAVKTLEILELYLSDIKFYFCFEDKNEEN